VEMTVTCDSEVLIMGYPGAFTQIFTNLILNSIIHGFTDDRPNKIELQIHDTDDLLTIDYFDNGVGISDDIREKIFKMFFTTMREEGGSGLGLHIVKNLLKEQFEASIDCIPMVEGVQFHIEIPKNKAE